MGMGLALVPSQAINGDSTGGGTFTVDTGVSTTNANFAGDVGADDELLLLFADTASASAVDYKLYKSTDLAVTWQEYTIHSGNTADTIDGDVEYADENTYFVGSLRQFRRSINGGVSWGSAEDIATAGCTTTGTITKMKIAAKDADNFVLGITTNTPHVYGCWTNDGGTTYVPTDLDAFGAELDDLAYVGNDGSDDVWVAEVTPAGGTSSTFLQFRVTGMTGAWDSVEELAGSTNVNYLDGLNVGSDRNGNVEVVLHVTRFGQARLEEYRSSDFGDTWGFSVVETDPQVTAPGPYRSTSDEANYLALQCEATLDEISYVFGSLDAAADKHYGTGQSVDCSMGGLYFGFTVDSRVFIVGADLSGTISVPESAASGFGFTQVAVTDLIEADADNAGRVVIARLDSGENVTTFNGVSLADLATLATPTCGFAGVHALNKEGTIYVSFGDCDGSGDVDTLKVRDKSLGDPEFPNGCAGECQQDNEQDPTDFDIPADLNDLGALYLSPYSFTFNDDPGNVDDFGYASWTFSTLSGEIGVVVVGYEEGIQSDTGDRELIDISPGTPVSDFCSWHNGEANLDFFAGVSEGGLTTAATARINFNERGPLHDLVTIESDVIWQNGNPLGQAHSIACAGHQAIVKKGTDVYFVNVTNPAGTEAEGTLLWSVLATGDSNTKAVALSGNREWVAWRDGGNIRIAYGSNGTVAGSVPVPSGAWRSMELDQAGNILYVFTNDFITRYEVGNFTCRTLATGCTINVDDGNRTTLPSPVSSPGPRVGGVFGGNAPPGWSARAFNGFLGVVLMAAVAGGFFFVLGQSAIAAGIGAVVGFLLSFFFDLFEGWVVLVVVALAVAVTVLAWLRRGG